MKALPDEAAGEDPAGDDGVTIQDRPLARCAECGRKFHRQGRGYFCSPRCRQRAYRGRLAQPVVGLLTKKAARARSRDVSAYQCPKCEERYLGSQRCESCGVFSQSLGYGVECPHCNEIIVLNELLAELGLPGLS